MATTLLGPLLPLLASRWALSDASAGALFTAQFVGQLTATTMSTAIADRIGAQRTLAVGFALVAAGVGALAVVPGPLAWAAVVLYGLGLGCVLPLTNIQVAALAQARAASALSLVNVSWGVGAMAWPLIVATLIARHAAAPTIALAVASVAMGFAWLAMPQGRASSAGAVPLPTAGTRAPARVVATYGVLILLYVGSETAISGWVAAFARRMASGAGAWAYAPAAFWSAQTAGRLLTPVLLHRVSEARLLLGSLLTSVVAVLLLSGAATTVGGVIVASALAGVGVAAVFPLLWAGVSRDVAPGRPSAVGPLFAAGGVGGALLPWMVGVVSTGYGLGTGLLVPLCGLVLMLGIGLFAKPRLPQALDVDGVAGPHRPK